MNLNLQPVTKDDCELLFNWVNDPEVRNASFNPNQIVWTEHQDWFYKKIQDPNSIQLILVSDGQKVGQIRFDKDLHTNEFLLNYLIEKNYRGRSLGTSLITKGIEYLKNNFASPYRIIGFVKKNNIPSQKSFLNNNFVPSEGFDDRIKFVKNSF